MKKNNPIMDIEKMYSFLLIICDVIWLLIVGGFWVLGSGYWVLGSGYWVLGTGYWVLGAGYFFKTNIFKVTVKIS